ncbi:DUF1294 domain-containing protein [Virgibacillus oceani]|uniref:DUF1294 domain-containing protein n=1 Tax=Virgibacillus oceani TaxID=1479511 RepID=A0A917LWP0_9BACI|nr:DUF1294 domain-containing protein [Virgibacillus oceani]GGG62011.1 hypothetical protein GCM10011398_01630 [Virgibacillus oceani]
MDETIILAYIIGINIGGFILMGLDKQRAKKRAWRISEKTLWITAILGGGIGSFLGMQVFRHKTKHALFRIGMPILIIVQLVLWIYISFVS